MSHATCALNVLSPRCGRTAFALGLLLTLAACGGGPDDDMAPAAERAAVAAAVERPADGGASARSGRYADAAQAETLAQDAQGDAIEIDVACCDAVAVDRAVGLVWALQAARDLPREVPVLVRGEDLRLAAAAAARLSEGGLTQVWVVMP
jgi:hypothetical protein